MKKSLTFVLVAVAMIATPVAVSAQTIPSFSVSPAPICQASTVVHFTNTTVSTGTRLSYYWDFGWSCAPSTVSWNTATPPPITYGMSGAPIVYLQVYDSDTHVYYTYEDHSITVNPAPNITSYLPSSPMIDCHTPAVAISVTTTTTARILWSYGGVVVDSGYTIMADTAGLYTVMAYSPIGCPSYSGGGIWVSEIPSPHVRVNLYSPHPTTSHGDTLDACEHDMYELDVYLSGGMYPYTYIWNTGSTDPNVSPTTNGIYEVQVTDANGCIGIDSAYLVINPLPSAVITTAGHPCIGDTMVLSLPAGNTYLWIGGDTTQTITTTMGGYFSAIITGPQGCVSETPLLSVPFNPMPTPTVTATDCHLAVTIADVGAIYQWYRYGTPIAGASGQFYDCSALGSGYYSVQETSSAGCQGFSPVEYSDCIGTGVSVIADIKDIKLYPNPCTDFFSINLPTNSNFEISLYDPIGHTIFSKQGNGILEFETRAIPSGIYFLAVKDSDGKAIHHERIVKN